LVLRLACRELELPFVLTFALGVSGAGQPVAQARESSRSTGSIRFVIEGVLLSEWLV
jgi:hypothetical protein